VTGTLAIDEAARGRPLVAMFVRNQFTHDARVTREATTLIELGFDVVVFAVTTTPDRAGADRQGAIRVFRITLPTIVSLFFGLLGRVVGLYARIVSIPRRIARAWRYVRRTVHLTPAELAEATAEAGIAKRIAARVLRAAGAPLRRVIPPPPPEPPPVLGPPRTVPTANRMRVGLRNFAWPMHRFLQGLRFARIAGGRAAALRPVAYHCHDLNALPAGFRARKRWPAPLIYDAHELWPHRNRPDARRRKTWVVEKGDGALARRVDAVITVNDSIAEHLRRRYRLRNVTVVRNTPSLTTTPAGASDGLQEIPRPRLMYVGGIQTHRGLEEMIHATVLMPGVTFVGMGPGNDDYRAELVAQAEAAGVAGRVRFLPSVPPSSVIPTIAGADLGLAMIKNYCLSYYLSLPNKFFEYLHAGVPVVASDFPEMRRLVDRYGVGATCDPAEPEAIARTVMDLLSRPEDLKRMSENALAAARELNWERERNHLIDLYRSLVPEEKWPG
jgi:glycosyltransferase involved in cell wall biosynthesis